MSKSKSDMDSAPESLSGASRDLETNDSFFTTPASLTLAEKTAIMEELAEIRAFIAALKQRHGLTG